MTKTTVYLPDDLKRGLTRAARIRGVPESVIIREAIAAAVQHSDPGERGGLFASDVLLAGDVDAALRGFGE